jgi:5-methylcytosine-specific restriction endonuclease McrA
MISLYNEGLKLKEIAHTMGVTTGTVASLIYRSNLKKNHPRIGYGRQALRNKLPKSCELCSYSRCLDIAHIIPVRLGGKFALENCLSLCPNCHHLFDHNLLSENEQSKLKDIYASRSKRTSEEIHGNLQP